jgi:hypothetical protein
MRILVKRSVAILFLMNLLISCSYEKIEKEAPFINKISPNKKFRINLPENHSDGYLWHLGGSYDPSVISYNSSVWHGNSKGVDFNFNTLSTGNTTLTFVLKKRADTSMIKHFVVEIDPN